MKKILLFSFSVISILLLSGCGEYKTDDAMKDFSKMVNDTKNYNIQGNLEILSNGETYNYNVEVLFKEGDYYRVNLTNKANNHEQIILKNEEGVYVITPVLNKSFKFQSEWPNNSSQAYILSTLLQDLENDKEKTFTSKDNLYIFNTKVNYPNNRNLLTEKITLDKKMKLKKVEVIDSEGVTAIKFVVTKMDTKTKINKEKFLLETNVDQNCCEEQTTMEELDEVIYPTYLPTNTTFKDEEKINLGKTERVILTFSGEKPFTLIQETPTIKEEFEIIPVYGELAMIDNGLGALTESSLNWNKGNKEFYLYGTNLSTEELVSIASSTIATANMK